jgi:hypothetical protein
MFLTNRKIKDSELIGTEHSPYLSHSKFRLETMKRSDHSEKIGIDRRIILKLILGKQVLGV